MRVLHYIFLTFFLACLSLIGSTVFAVSSFPSITPAPAKDSSTWSTGPNKAMMKQCCYTYPVYETRYWVDYTGDAGETTVIGCDKGQSLGAVYQYGDDMDTQSKKSFEGICVSTETKCDYVPVSQTSISYTYTSHEYPNYFQAFPRRGTAPCP